MKVMRLLFVGNSALAILLLAASTGVLAAPPTKENCEGDVYERLTCRQAAIAAQTNYTSEEIFKGTTELGQRISANRLAHINVANEKAQWAASRNTSEGFKRMTKAIAQGNKKGGYLIPLDPINDDMDQDGICDYDPPDNMSAKCAAIELDEYDQLQECNPEKKNKGGAGNGQFEGLECDVFYDFGEAVSDSETQDMDAIAENLELSYDVIEDDLIEMNNTLDLVNANLPVETAISSLAEDDNIACELPDMTEGLDGWIFGLRETHAVLEGAGNIAADFGSQTFVIFGHGGNTRSLAVGFHSASLIANIAYITVDEINRREQEALQKAIMNCVGQSSGEIQQILSGIADLKQQLHNEHDAIETNDKLNTDEIVRLLHTPEGMRTSERLCNELPCSYPFIPPNWPQPPGSD